MPEQVRCPECNAALRVPEKLLGKNVKCPKCQTTFTAEMEGLDELEEVVDEPAPAARRRLKPSEDEEELPPEEEYEERPRQRRRGRRRAEAAAAVAAPAISLLVLGILGILMGIANVGYAVLARNDPPIGQGNRAIQNPDPAFNTGANAGYKAGRYIGAFVSLIWAIIIVAGSVKMKGLHSYGSAMTACIVAICPCSLCCLLGIPFGIWGLVALNKPGVKDAFS